MARNGCAPGAETTPECRLLVRQVSKHYTVLHAPATPSIHLPAHAHRDHAVSIQHFNGFAHIVRPVPFAGVHGYEQPERLASFNKLAKGKARKLCFIACQVEGDNAGSAPVNSPATTCSASSRLSWRLMLAIRMTVMPKSRLALAALSITQSNHLGRSKPRTRLSDRGKNAFPGEECDRQLRLQFASRTTRLMTCGDW
jgi:hypothetical protein